ncbi:uncharacterized protein [Argopecten irradians]|uniref:uncharacterized protein n=1 Tax=Argopecten irradians TaxID=31199 RepID=UPI00371108A7
MGLLFKLQILNDITDNDSFKDDDEYIGFELTKEQKQLVEEITDRYELPSEITTNRKRKKAIRDESEDIEPVSKRHIPLELDVIVHIYPTLPTPESICDDDNTEESKENIYIQKLRKIRLKKVKEQQASFKKKHDERNARRERGKTKKNEYLDFFEYFDEESNGGLIEELANEEMTIQAEQDIEKFANELFDEEEWKVLVMMIMRSKGRARDDDDDDVNDDVDGGGGDDDDDDDADNDVDDGDINEDNCDTDQVGGGGDTGGKVTLDGNGSDADIDSRFQLREKRTINRPKFEQGTARKESSTTDKPSKVNSNNKETGDKNITTSRPKRQRLMSPTAENMKAMQKELKKSITTTRNRLAPPSDSEQKAWDEELKKLSSFLINNWSITTTRNRLAPPSDSEQKAWDEELKKLSSFLINNWSITTTRNRLAPPSDSEQKAWDEELKKLSSFLINNWNMDEDNESDDESDKEGKLSMYDIEDAIPILYPTLTLLPSGKLPRNTGKQKYRKL